MNINDFEDFSKKFKDESMQLNKEFIKLFKKWLKKSPKLAVLNLLNMPLNLMLNIMTTSNVNFYELIPDLPSVYIRSIAPFIILKDEYEKLTNKEFVDKYQKLYESQFDKNFLNNDQKKEFKKWFDDL
jgi:hypothetical protein